MEVYNIEAESHFDYGLAVGKRFHNEIRQMADNQTTLKNVKDTPEVRKIVEGYLSICEKQYPQYVKEIRGYAEGADVPFDILFKLHLETELNGVKSCEAFKVNGCSTMMSNSGETFLVHTEDQISEIASFSVLINAKIGHQSEEFLVFCCPGLLPGSTFSYNRYGLAQSLNALFQSRIHLDNLPRRFLIRAMLSAKNIDDAVRIAQSQKGVANGFNMNYLQLEGSGMTNMASIEVFGTPTYNIVHKHTIQNTYYHLNNYRQINHKESLPDPSSEGREERLKAILQDKSVRPSSLAAILGVMSDRDHPEYPIYRDGRSPDYLSTAATVVFVVEDDAIQMRVYKGPATSNQQVFNRKFNNDEATR